MTARARKAAGADRVDEGAALLRAVHDNPGDDGPRLVYADWLQERGDPRGELIVLQCSRTARTEAQLERERALLADHGKAWAGKAAAILDPALLVFARGFLHGGRIKSTAPSKIERARGAPEWSTVEQLLVGEEISSTAVVTLLLDPALRSLRSLRDVSWALLQELLLHAEGPFPLVEISATVSDPLIRRAPYTSDVRLARLQTLFDNTPSFPSLRRLELEGWETQKPDLAWLFTRPLVAQLDRLVLRGWSRPAAVLAAVASAARRAVVEIPEEGWRLCAAPGPAGPLALTALPAQGESAPLLALTRALMPLGADALSSLVVEARPASPPRQVDLDAMRLAVRRLTRLERIELPEAWR